MGWTKMIEIKSKAKTLKGIAKKLTEYTGDLWKAEVVWRGMMSGFIVADGKVITVYMDGQA